MPISKAQQKATAVYHAKNYDQVITRVPKGKKQVIQTHAAEQGKSLNAFVNEAIDEKIEKETKKADF